MYKESTQTYHEVLEAYISNFGHTFSPFGLTKNRHNAVKKLMLEAIKGERGVITDKELDMDLPDGALM